MCGRIEVLLRCLCATQAPRISKASGTMPVAAGAAQHGKANVQPGKPTCKTERLRSHCRGNLRLSLADRCRDLRKRSAFVGPERRQPPLKHPYPLGANTAQRCSCCKSCWTRWLGEICMAGGTRRRAEIWLGIICPPATLREAPPWPDWLELGKCSVLGTKYTRPAQHIHGSMCCLVLQAPMKVSLV